MLRCPKRRVNSRLRLDFDAQAVPPRERVGEAIDDRPEKIAGVRAEMFPGNFRQSLAVFSPFGKDGQST
jgi:hypothetical protein